MTRKEAYIILNSLPLIGPIRVGRLLDVFETPEAILSASESALSEVQGIGPKAAEALANWSSKMDLDDELQRIERSGVHVLTPVDDDYPEGLRLIPDAPLVLYVKGQLETLKQAYERGLAVVGSRKTTLYGQKAAETLVRSAANAGWVIVSGLARGIDTIAHRTTVDGDGRTIAVLGGGLDQVFPPENIPLATSICDKGCVITEQPMNMRPDRRTFPMRNRIIAALCPATLVVEAGRNSGSLITAQKAQEFGRKIFAVPGRIDSPQSMGCNDLIREGARLTASLDDIAAAFAELPGLAVDGPQQADLFDLSPTTKPSVPAELTPVETRICDLLKPGDIGIDELVNHSGEPVHKLLSVLMGLELKRVVKQLPGKRFALYN